MFIATQLNSTRRRVELRRYRHFADATQINSTSSGVELCRYRRVSVATQLNSTQLDQLNSVQPSQSCFCLWRHDLQTESTGSLRSLIRDSCSRYERVDNSTSSWVELCRYKHPLRPTSQPLSAILIFDKCLSPRQTTANNCKTAFSLHVVESVSDDYNF